MEILFNVQRSKSYTFCGTALRQNTHACVYLISALECYVISAIHHFQSGRMKTCDEGNRGDKEELLEIYVEFTHSRIPIPAGGSIDHYLRYRRIIGGHQVHKTSLDWVGIC